MPREWPRLASRAVADCRIYRVRADTNEHPVTGFAREYFVLESADWVNAIALTAAAEVVLIEQFRHGTRQLTVEIPGGMVDAGEDPLAAGVRELREETGYGGGRATLMGSCEPNPAILGNRCWFVLVEGVEPVAEPNLDENEDIGVRLVPIAEALRLIDDGTISHALVIAAFHRLGRVRRELVGGPLSSGPS